MELILGLLFLLLVVAVIGGVGTVLVMWVYWWCSGMIDTMHIWLGMPGWLTICLAIAIALFLRPGMLILAIFGFIGWVSVLHYNWITGLLVYAPTIAFLFVSFIATLVIAVLAGAAQLWSNIRRR